MEEAKKLKAKGVNIVSIDLLYDLKSFFDPNTTHEELSKISSPLKPIESEYFDLDEHVREVTDLLCSCKFTFVLVIILMLTILMMILMVMMMMMILVMEMEMILRMMILMMMVLIILMMMVLMMMIILMMIVTLIVY